MGSFPGRSGPCYGPRCIWRSESRAICAGDFLEYLVEAIPKLSGLTESNRWQRARNVYNGGAEASYGAAVSAEEAIDGGTLRTRVQVAEGWSSS
uniref:Phage tail protein n=1 Tax=Haemonchus contortus TaxID=6289 RepID=A0A7I4YSK7_HAECO